MKVNPGPASASSKRRVFLVDDHAVVREGLIRLINGQPDLIVCGETDNGPDAVDAVGRLKPDLVIVDLALRKGSGLELVKQLKALHPQLPMLILSMHDELLYAERSLRAGALGYVMKCEEGKTFLQAIRTVLTGEVFVSPSMNRRLIQIAAHRADGDQRSGLDNLSDREIEIFRMLGQGLTTRQIAQQLHIAVTTVETHCAHLKLKLHLPNAAELRLVAIKWLDL